MSKSSKTFIGDLTGTDRRCLYLIRDTNPEGSPIIAWSAGAERSPRPVFGIGERVLYRGAWGTLPAVETVVTGLGAKCGRLVYDLGEIERWGYEEQIEKLTEEGI
jgi:hypothetical protein